MSRSPVGERAQGIGVRAPSWTSLRFMPLQVAVRRTTPARITDDRYFPVRVRIAVPPNGFGNQLDKMVTKVECGA